jgi:nitrogen fixation/metabolism regulation signal transduction histidine kinase
LKDNIGKIVYKVGDVHSRSDIEFNPNSHDGCYNTVIPVIHGDQLLGTIRMGVRTDGIAQARERLISESVFFALFWFTIFMLPFFMQIRRLVRPLGDLSYAAQQFADGNLDYPTPVVEQGNDEISRLTVSFREMAQALVVNRDRQAATLTALSHEKTTFDALLATMPVGVVFADHDHIRYCNATFLKLCQFGKDEQLVGMKNDAMLLSLMRLAADANAFFKTVAEILETHKFIESKYITLKDGRILRVISNIVIAPENNAYLGRFWIFEDATDDQKKLHTAELRTVQESSIGT